MKKRRFTKRRSNLGMLSILAVVNIIGIAIAIVIIVLEVEQPFKHSTGIVLVVLAIVVTTTLLFSLPFWGKLGKYSWRINQLFELFAKTVTVSNKMVFPVVGLSYDSTQDSFCFQFRWAGKVSIGVQAEIEHRLAEKLFPDNEYLLEEPRKTPAYTEYLFTRRPERLRKTYVKKT